MKEHILGLMFIPSMDWILFLFRNMVMTVAIALYIAILSPWYEMVYLTCSL